ncbi:MAG: hypothetical protein H8D78_02675 [Chloroflexi bacterium]|nr:hypothetical protein [Chloroflexota bacterium]
MAFSRPTIIDQDLSQVRALRPVGVQSHLFTEDWLQRVLFAHPHLLPIEDIEPDFGPLVPLAREFSVTAGSIDILYATADGSICIVETKLWRNPEAHRTVLAQLLDYAKGLASLDYADFKTRVETAAQRHGYPSDLDQIMARAVGHQTFDSIGFEQGMRRSLATGNFLLLIVGDRIRPGVAMLSDILGATPHLEFSLAMVEIAFYRLDPGQEWPVLAVPSVVGRSHEVTRAVVRIRYEEKRPEVDVAAAEDETQASGRTNLDLFLKSLPSGVDEIFRTYLERWMAGPFTVYWGKVGFSLRYAPKTKLVTIFDAYPDYMCLFMEKWLPSWGHPTAAYQAYREAIGGIPEVDRTLVRDGRYMSYARMSLEDVRTVLEATDRLARALAAGQR